MDQQIEYRWLARADINTCVAEDIISVMYALTGRVSHLRSSTIAEIVSRDDAHVIGAMVNFPEAGGERLIGIAMLVEMRTFSGHAGRIEDVVVLPLFRGCGIGKGLMAKLIERAKERELHHVELTSRPERVEANTFYQRLGFTRRDTNVYRLVRGGMTDGFPTSEITKPDVLKLRTASPTGARPPGTLLDLERVENAMFPDIPDGTSGS